MDRFQLIVIGGGPGGYSAALRSAALGLKTLLVEKEHLGGTCLNHGCIPTKTLEYTATLYRKLKSAAHYGIYAEEISLDFSQAQQRRQTVIEHLTGGISDLLKAAGVTVWFGQARLLSPNQVVVTLPGGEKRLAETEKIILATGSTEITPLIPGMELPGVIYSRQALALTKIPASMAVIGGGVIALEMAGIFAAFGTSVTIVQRSVLLRREDREMVRRLTPYLRKQGIRIMTGTVLQNIAPGQEGELLLDLSTPRGEETLSVQKTLVAVGRKPYLEGLGLESLGIKQGSRGIEVDDRMSSNIPGIYAVGDVATPGYFLAHTAIHQGLAAAENAAGRSVAFQGEVVPVCIFTHPQMARVGLTEEEAVAKGYPVKIGKFPFSANGKAFLQNEGDGLVKIVADREKETILGMHILGPQASDLILEGALAVAAGVKVADLERLIHPHPTLSEATWEASLSVFNVPLHLASKRNP